MKKILFISCYTPGKYGAGVAYTDNLIKELSKSFIIDMLLFSYPGDQPYGKGIENLNVINNTLVTKHSRYRYWLRKPYIFPLFTARYDKQVVRVANDLIAKNKYECVYLDFSQTFAIACDIKHENIIMMSHDVISQSYERKHSKLVKWVEISEKNLLKKAKAIFTFSPKDCDLIKNKYGLDSFYTTFFLSEDVCGAVPSDVCDYFVFFGTWNRVENSEAILWFMDNVYPLLNSTVNIKIIGGGMDKELITKVKQFPNIEPLGFVDNPYTIIANAKAAIAPLHYGAGVKVKCIESLACGTSIIGTEVAFEGIDEIYNGQMILANTPQEYAEAINQINPSLDDKITSKRYFIENYNDKQILKYLRK